MNHIVESLRSCWPDIDYWTRSCNFLLNGQHGQIYNGNTCRAILGPISTHDLESRLPLELQSYVAALKALNKVVETCFGQDLAEDYIIAIASFQRVYFDLGISVTPKEIPISLVMSVFHFGNLNF